jgi:arsenate reductase
MKEIGIDIFKHHSKNLTVFDGQSFDYVITLCGSAHETCPLYIGGTKKMHIGFDDPAAATGSEEDILREYCRVRDEIKERLTDFFQAEKIID